MTLDAALTARTSAEVLDDVADEIAARGGDDKSFPETSTARQLLISYSDARAREEELRSELVKAGSLSLVEDISVEDGRDAWIEYMSRGTFALERDQATYALHRFRLINAATGVSRTFAPRQLRARFGAVDFLNVTVPEYESLYAGSGTLPPGGTLDLLFEAQTAGSAGNIPAGYLTQLVTVFAGVSISNPAITGTGGSVVRAARDAERNGSLLDRDRARWGASSAGGAEGSIVEWIHEAFVAAGLPNPITKWHVDDANPDGPGTTRSYLATDAGPAPADAIAVAQAYLTQRACVGRGSYVGVLVLPAIARAVSFSATLKSSNANAAILAAAAVTALNAEMQLGTRTLYRNEVIERLMGIPGTTDIPALDLENIVLEAGENLLLTGSFQVVS